MTALIVAVKGGYTAVVKELLKRKPNVNMTDKDGNTALMIAAKEGYTEIVQDLLDAGTYVNIPDRVRARHTPRCLPHATEQKLTRVSMCVTEWRYSADWSREGGACGNCQSPST